MKADVAFEMFRILGVDFYCFHDFDVRPEGDSFAENAANLAAMVDYLQAKPRGGGCAPTLGYGQSIQPSALHGWRCHQPRP